MSTSTTVLSFSRSTTMPPSRGRWIHPVLILGFVASLGGFGCSASSEEEGPLTESSFLEAYASELCNRISPCCVIEDRSYDASYCRNNATTRVQSVKRNLESRGLPWKFHTAHASRCLDQLREHPLDCSESLAADCSMIYTGTVETGEPCSEPLDCRAVDAPWEEAHNVCAYYRTAGGQDAVFCQLSLMNRKNGEPCDVAVGDGPLAESVVETCASGLCYRGTCLEYSGLGGKCPCLDEFKCDYQTDTCVPLSEVGGSCGDYWDCASGSCDSDTHTCKSTSETYAPSCNNDPS